MGEATRNSLLAAAKQLCDLMYQWNVVNVYELVIDSPQDGGSVYHHVNKALERTLQHLGCWEPHIFYDLVTQGQSPVEALAKVEKHQAERMA